MTKQKEEVGNTPISISSILDEHAALIKTVFKDNGELLRIMRNLFFSFELSKTEKDNVLKNFGKNSKLIEAVRRKMVPLFSDTIDLPVGVVSDYWLGLESEILGAANNAIYQRVNSKIIVFDMLMVAIDLLKNPDGPKVLFTDKPSLNDEYQIGLLARSLYIRSVGAGLEMLRQIAQMVEKSPDELAKQAAFNSNK